MSQLLTAERVLPFLPDRPADGHKGTFGRLLVIGGCAFYPGAPLLCAAAAARSGAGLVRIAAGRSTLSAAGRLLEAPILPLPEAGWGVIAPEAVAEIAKYLGEHQALVVGPGLSSEEPAQAFVRRLLNLEAAKPRGRVGFFSGEADSANPSAAATTLALPPTVLDADALNLLAISPGWAEQLPANQFVLTPHPGEMARLRGEEHLSGEPLEMAREAAQQWGQVVVLKGAQTAIAAPDGQALLHDRPNPALATAGSGDVLAGIIGALLAQGCSPFAAACLGVYLHGAAGDLVRQTVGIAGAIASDQIAHLPHALTALYQRKA